MSTTPDLMNQHCGQHPATGARIRIGVMGSAAEFIDPELIERCRSLGHAIAKQGCCVLTGACPGMPHEVVLGAKDAGGQTMGISPAVHLKEHIETFASPILASASPSPAAANLRATLATADV